MNKKSVISLIILVLLVIAGVIFYITKGNDILKKEKLYNFEEFNLLTNKVNLIADQDNVDEEFFEKIDKGEYTLSDPLIIHNPYNISPLTAIVGFKTSEKVTIKVTIKGKDGGKDLAYNTKEATSHYIPIYGLYLDYVNEIILEASDNTSNTINIPVEQNDASAIIYFPDVEILNNKLEDTDEDFYFISTPIGNTAAAFDQKGEIRWYLTNQIYKQLTKLSNGHFLLSSSEAMEDQSLGFLEVDLLGKVYNSYELSKPYFHNFVELPNGNVLYATSDEKIIELNLANGNVEKTYDIYEMLSEIDSNHMKNSKNIFGYINSLDYDTKTNSILVGLFYNSTLININKNGKIEWIFANPEYYSSKFTKYLLKPTNPDFKYPKGNFNAKLNNTNLTLINNGWDLTDTWSCEKSIGLKSSAKDYKLNLDNKIITEEWNYGDNYFSFTFGDYYNKDSEKTIMFGREFRAFQEKMNICKLSDEGDFYSTIITLKDNEEVFKMTVSNTYNYVSKMPIYDNDYTLSKVTAKSYTATQLSDPHKEEDYQSKYNESILYTIPLELSGNKLSIMYNEENYKVVLLDEYGKAYIYDAKDNAVTLKKEIGNALILLEHDGNIYNTGYYINI
ncbi:MAG: aryl-sulfate sulfotransferase [Bacilli bacterium]|nr:aryl-sulfate sulfotransferase [Bacilli bacterium]